jgi:hypothetical protein
LTIADSKDGCPIVGLGKQFRVKNGLTIQYFIHSLTVSVSEDLGFIAFSKGVPVVRNRLAAVLFLAAATALSPLVEGLANAATPPLMWVGAKRVNVLCNVAGGPGIDQRALTSQLCRDVTRLAAEGSPIPVRTIALGDPAVLAPDAVTLLVHASVASQGASRLIAISVRPYRTSSEQASVLFGAAPRAATIPNSAGGSPALDAALHAALSETLPWLARPRGAQPITNRP